MMLKFQKGDALKLIQEGSTLIKILEKDGWKQDKPEVKKEPKKGKK